MGRVSRYRRVKQVFDVENLFSGSGEGKPVAAFKTKQGFDSSSRKRNMIVKYGPDGQPLNAPEATQKKREDKEKEKPKREKEGDEDVATEDGESAGQSRPKKKLELEGRRKGEKLRDFYNRVNRETQQHLLEANRSGGMKAARGKDQLQKRKAKKMEKKRRRAGYESEDEAEVSKKERKIYERQKPTGLYDIAQAPPEFTSEHQLKQRKNLGPNDRARFAKLSSAVSTSTTSSGKETKGNMSKYEKAQMEAMRQRVLNRYDDLRNKRRSAREESV